MSTVDTSTWNPDADFNVEIEGIPLNSDADIAQTWQALRILMAAVKGDGDAIKSTIDVMQGATASADGASGLVPKPEAGDQDKVLKGDGTWGTVAAASHTHGNITSDGKVGTASGKPLVTGTGGAVQAGSFGSTAGTFCEGNDSRLSDARTPTSHTHGSITNDGKLGTASRVVVTDTNKKIAVSSVTVTELGYLSGVTSNVQTHLTDLDNEFLLVKGVADNAYAVGTANTLLIQDLQDALDTMLKTKIYPVGSTFFSLTDSRNPSVILGFGTWAKIEGRFLLGASSSYAANGTGGEAAHTLTASELPDPSTYLAAQFVWEGQADSSGAGYWRFVVAPKQAAGLSSTGRFKSTSTTIGQPHNNMPPYLAGYLWRRTA